MKISIFLIALVLVCLAFTTVKAQVSVSVNIGVQPVWGPVGYDHVDYYYIPDVDAYYDVPAHVYVYNEGGVWVRRPSLPPRFASFDLYHGYKVVLNEPTPWVHHDVIRTKYIGYKGHAGQVVIRDSHEPKYFVNKDHPEHGKWKGDEHGGGEHRTNVSHNTVQPNNRTNVPHNTVQPNGGGAAHENEKHGGGPGPGKGGEHGGDHGGGPGKH